ncbi:MAG: site-specific integrase, partial [Parvularculaceae bacterium]
MQALQRYDEPNLTDLRGSFEAYLRGERRASPATVRNYAAALERFDGFMGPRADGPLDADRLSRLEARDFRAFLAHRRDEGLSASSLKLELSALKSFFRFARARWSIENDAIAATRGPRAKARLPRPVSAEGARNLLDASKADAPSWIKARDAAVFLLLYGAGLRISEAL